MVEYLKCQGKENSKTYIPAFDRRMFMRNMIQWGAIGYDVSDCSIQYFGVGLPLMTMGTFVVKYL